MTTYGADGVIWHRDCWYADAETAIAQTLLKHLLGSFRPSEIAAEAQVAYVDIATTNIAPWNAIHVNTAVGLLRRLKAVGGAHRAPYGWWLTDHGVELLNARLADDETPNERGRQREPRQTQQGGSMPVQTNLPTRSRVFIDGKTRPLYAITEFVDLQTQLQARDPAVIGTDVHGDEFAIPANRVVSVTEAHAPVEAVQTDGGIMYGRRVEIRHLKAWNADHQDPIEAIQPPDGVDNYVAVIGEDLASDLCVVVNPATGHVAWANPAVPEGAIQRYITIARLACEAEQLVVDEYTEHVEDAEQA